MKECMLVSGPQRSVQINSCNLKELCGGGRGHGQEGRARQDDLTFPTLPLPEDLAYCYSNSNCCEVSGRVSILIWWEWKVPGSEGTRPLRSYQCVL